MDSCENKESVDRSQLEKAEREEKTFPGLLSTIFSFFALKKPETKEDLGQEIQDLLEEGEEHGLISSLEEQMINSILEFHDTCASEIMTPVAEFVACEVSVPLQELVDLVIDSGFTRIPVYQETLDKIIGIVHVKDLFRACVSKESLNYSIQDCLRPVNFVDEEKPIVDLLREFQRTKIHIAIVQDEFGSIRGLLTLEDILEEIVGEIDDEYDDDEELTLKVVEDGSLLVHGWVDVEKLEEYYEIEFPEGPYESVGGFVVHCLGRLAKTGDVVKSKGLRMEVLEISDRHIKRLRVTKVEETSPLVFAAGHATKIQSKE